ncbi:ATP-binding cassette domain-containing protein [Brevibacillus fulvus]|uniref:Sodium transport system ATP-binding protein n=1 Tax=Brevibacillus fulvus TaxID=1125967 RepID=A0A938XXQ5_9BACL|nr:ATP-binding cassette domain-containing protein [Brevibacillus fulvus]MBM7589573.1 sodium transport system ATP-binding protein [Brevibacillus fulvus]
MIELDSVTKRFERLTAVERVSLQIQSGEVLGLLGENGAGKTTLMRMMATILTPTEGEIVINGFSVRHQQVEVRRQIGILFGGEIGLYNRLTARENIAYFGQLYGIAPDRLARRIEELSEMLEMQDYLDRRVGGFSRGMKQKVAIARVLVHDPQIVLLDEPTTGLDVGAASIFRALIRQMKAAGKTILFSSHHMGEIEKLCDRVAIMHCGRLCYEGTLPRLRAMYGFTDLDELFLQVLEKEGER